MNPEQINASDWKEEYAKQRYNRLCDTIAEYMEAEEGHLLFEMDFLKAIKDLASPLKKQLGVLETIEGRYYFTNSP